MIWGVDLAPGQQIKFGEKVLQPVKQTKHMGITLQSSSNHKNIATSERIKKAKCVILAARGIGSNSVPVPPSVMLKIYWNVVLSSALYGMEGLNVKRGGGVWRTRIQIKYEYVGPPVKTRNRIQRTVNVFGGLRRLKYYHLFVGILQDIIIFSGFLRRLATCDI